VLAPAGPDEEDVQLFHEAGMSREGGAGSRRVVSGESYPQG